MAGLYFHIPFCTRKCAYCDFFSASPRANQLTTWHLLLQKNLELLSKTQPESLESIFFGGGTPSLLSAAQVSSVLDKCHDLFGLSLDCEVSLEANPADLTSDRLWGYHAAGINRLSIGIQSFSDHALEQLGRRHTAEQAIQAYRAARQSGFSNISLDLIFALPGQTLEELQTETARLIDLAPEHIGIYGLSIESGTPLEKKLLRGLIQEADEETYAACYEQLSRQLTAAGYEHYEISNFARPGYRCRHNQAYWQRKTCLAAGAGAHAFSAKGYGQRTSIPQDLSHYAQQLSDRLDPAEILENFDRRQAMSETLYLGLRTTDGVDIKKFASRFGQTPQEAFPEALTKLSPYLYQAQERWVLNHDGWLIYDHLISYFL